jgi:two-component system cell cycle sensor histidine kinase PleC
MSIAIKDSGFASKAPSAPPTKGDARQGDARPGKDRGQHSTILLVWLFLFAFVLAVGIQIDTRRRDAAVRSLDDQSMSASLLSERVGSNIGLAWGAAAGAAELGRTSGLLYSDPHSVAIAAAHARPVRGAAIVSRNGAVLGITDPTIAEHVSAAYRSAGRRGVWTGAPDMGGQATAPAIVRHVGDYAIVSILKANALLPELNAQARVLIATEAGAVLYASPGLESAGLRMQQSMITAATPGGAARGGAFLEDQNRSWAVGSAPILSSGLRVYVAQQAPSALERALRAIAEFALLAAAPFASVGVLFLLLRQNTRRAEIAEEDAVRAEATFGIAVDGANVGVFEWRLENDQVQLSERAMRLMGATADTLSLPQVVALANGEERITVEDEFRRARQSGIFDARFRIGHGPGLAWIEMRGTLIDDRAGGQVLIGTVLDVTPRHEAEAQVSRLERALRTAIDSYTGPFALWDARRRLIMWNETYGRIFGLGPELLRVRASYAAIAAAAAPRIKREPPSEGDARTIELIDGQWFQIVERRTADGGLVTVGVDITELKRKEEEIARNEQRLAGALARAETQEYEIKAAKAEADRERQKAEDASRAKSAFLANMSHELRTPLNAIIGFSEIMDKELLGPIGSEQYKTYSHDIWESGNHLLLLINDILDMAKIEAGKFTLSPHPLAVTELIEAAVRMNKPGADNKSLPISVDAENLPDIEADARAVKQMVSNLLSNAVKFTDQGMVLVQGRTTNWGIVIRVADTGCGIPPEHLVDLATPFKQVETELSRNHQGTGLGLALTKTLAEMHGGKMKIQSEVGKGTIVSLYLPLKFAGARPEDQAA